MNRRDALRSLIALPAITPMAVKVADPVDRPFTFNDLIRLERYDAEAGRLAWERLQRKWAERAETFA